MSKLPKISGRKLIAILRKANFEVIRVKGSHNFLRHSDGRTTVIPVHGNEVIGTGLFFKILKDCELSTDEFFELM